MPFHTVMASSSLAASVPRRERIWRMTMSFESTRSVQFFKQMPPPGADCPAMVMRGLLTVRFELRAMVPETLKRIVRPEAGAVLMPSRSEPAPESLRLVTKYKSPPRPPRVLAPAPSAPGNAVKGGMGVQPPKVVERLRRAVAWVLLIWDENVARPLTFKGVPARSVL